jgi:hypothetical protein
MTIILEDVESDESLNGEARKTVKCSWCGEIIEYGWKVLAVAMCEACHAKMLADFQKAQQHLLPSPHASER